MEVFPVTQWDLLLSMYYLIQGERREEERRGDWLGGKRKKGRLAWERERERKEGWLGGKRKQQIGLGGNEQEGEMGKRNKRREKERGQLRSGW